MSRARKFEMFMGCFGNGTVIANKAVMEHGDYKNVCWISPAGNIKWYVDMGYVPDEDRKRIFEAAEQGKRSFMEWFNNLSVEEQYSQMLRVNSPVVMELLSDKSDMSMGQKVEKYKNKYFDLM